MQTTFFAGLTALEPGEPISTDGSAIASRNPWLIDHFLKIGAVTHRHDAHPALANPTLAPSAVALPSGGAIPAGLTIEVGYTLTDNDGGETLLSDTADVTTQSSLAAPDGAPTLDIDYTGGELRVDTYFYGISFIDEAGGETGLGPMEQIERSPGFPSGQVQISGLLDLIQESGAAAWKLYRATGGDEFAYLASGVADTFTDTGGICADCNTKPPREGTNSTNQTSVLQVTLPGSGAISSGASTILLYGTVDGSFSTPALFGEYPVASAGATIEYPILDFLDGRPPAVSTCVTGANLIDPDTELLDWHWKRPVATAGDLPLDAEEGDVRVTLDDGVAHRYVSGAWGVWAMGGGGSNPEGGVSAEIDPGFPLAIPDDGTPLVVPINVPSSLAGFVQHLTLSLNITHAQASDLTVTLTAPDTFEVTVLDHQGDADFGIGPNFGETLDLMDDAAGPIEATGSNRGPHRPATPLEQFFFEPQEGEWLLTITDDVGGNAGELVSASLTFSNVGIYPMGHLVGWRDPFTNGTVAGLVGRQIDGHTSIAVRAISSAGVYHDTTLWSDRDGIVPIASGFASAWAGASPFNGEPDPEIEYGLGEKVTLSGEVVKASGGVPTVNEVMLTLPVDAIPSTNKTFPVGAGDSDGPVAGMVKIIGATDPTHQGEVQWLVGASTDPATKRPFVSLDGISYRP